MTTWEIYWFISVPVIILYTLWTYGFFDKQYEKHLIWKIIYWIIFITIGVVNLFFLLLAMMVGASAMTSAKEKYWNKK
jgi:TctA family transporter